MAVIVISEPFPLGMLSVSENFIFEVTSDLIGQNNFKYTFKIEVDGVEIGTKKVVSTGTNTTVDLSETIKQYISQTLEDGAGGKVYDVAGDILINPTNPSIVLIDITIGDQYELNSVIITSEIAPKQYISTRGQSSGNSEFNYASRYRDVGVSNNIIRVVRGEPMFVAYYLGDFDTFATFTANWQIFDKNGISKGSGVYSLPITFTSVKEFIAQVPVGTDNVLTGIPINSTIYRITYDLDTTLTGGVPVRVDVRVVDQCLENPVTLMFKNSYFQWSQFTFDAINSRAIQKTRDQWESQIDGMRDVNIKARDILTLNSTYISQDEAADIEDLFLSDEIYIIPSGERVTMDTSELPIKTRQKEKIINYTFKVKKSARIFKP